MKAILTIVTINLILSSLVFGAPKTLISTEDSFGSDFMSISPNGKISVRYSRPNSESHLIFKDEATQKIIWDFRCKADTCPKKTYFDDFINLRTTTVLEWSPDSRKLAVYNANGFEQGNYVWMIDVFQEKLIKEFYSRFVWGSSYSSAWNTDSSRFGFISVAYESSPRSARYRPEFFSIDGTHSSLEGSVEFPDYYQHTADTGCSLVDYSPCYSWHWISPTQIELSVFKPTRDTPPTYSFANLNFDFTNNRVSTIGTSGGYMWRDFGSNLLGYGTRFNGLYGQNYYIYNRKDGHITDVTVLNNQILSDIQTLADVPFAWLMKRAQDAYGHNLEVQEVKFADINGSVTSTYQIKEPPSDFSQINVFLLSGTGCAVVAKPGSFDVVDTKTGNVLAMGGDGDIGGGTALEKLDSFDGGVLFRSRFKIFKVSCK